MELDLEHYVIPAPSTSANSGLVYAANNAENPRFHTADGLGNVSYSLKDGGFSVDRPAPIKVYFCIYLIKYYMGFITGVEIFESII